ncbi:sugar phosphate isomerase/epimerase family protein [Alteromonas confluentis]|uniref:Xylose isomerase-like TIM barrel domain-containing protein n=1 Tax=Alteromonas confluentis TaxID=1656094 RepID=A0A1E7Z855_9ALTE|nr:sugar phosphate isomerase/epimerase family protein [Alteromonas confluentis]OFC69700.1 hypothetical protein BFC18_16665 [Alteromonas confluentis]
MKNLNIGVRAHDFAPGTPEQVADDLSQYPISCVQLAPLKSFPYLEEGPTRLTKAYAHRTRDAFAAKGLQIGVLGCYINPVHPDPASREASLSWFEKHLELAASFGCNIVGTETGSRNADCTFHPDNLTGSAFDDLVESVSRLAATAEKYQVNVGIEGVAYHHIINSPERMAEMLKQVNSPYMKVIYDPVNLYPQIMMAKQEDELDKSFDLFGDAIVAFHSKDFVLNNHNKEGDLPSGTGSMNHHYLLRWIQNNTPDVPVILENTNCNNVSSVLNFMQSQLTI